MIETNLLYSVFLGVLWYLFYPLKKQDAAG